MAEMPAMVYVATVDARHVGPGAIAVCRTREAAYRAIAKWCRDYWEHEGCDGPMPEDEDALIEAYFSQVDETYEVDACRYDDE